MTSTDDIGPGALIGDVFKGKGLSVDSLEIGEFESPGRIWSEFDKGREEVREPGANEIVCVDSFSKLNWKEELAEATLELSLETATDFETDSGDTEVVVIVFSPCVVGTITGTGRRCNEDREGSDGMLSIRLVSEAYEAGDSTVIGAGDLEATELPNSRFVKLSNLPVGRV